MVPKQHWNSLYCSTEIKSYNKVYHCMCNIPRMSWVINCIDTLNILIPANQDLNIYASILLHVLKNLDCMMNEKKISKQGNETLMHYEAMENYIRLWISLCIYICSG